MLLLYVPKEVFEMAETAKVRVPKSIRLAITASILGVGWAVFAQAQTSSAALPDVGDTLGNIGGAATAAVAPLVEPVAPTVAQITAPVVEKVVTPITVPVVRDVVAPVVHDVVVPVAKPIVSDVVAPVAKPIVSDVVAPVATQVVAPVISEVVAPVAQPVVTEVVAPVVSEVVTPVVTEVVAPVVSEVVTPVVTEVVAPVVTEVVQPIVIDVVTPIVDGAVLPIVEPVVDEVIVPVVDDVLAPVVDGVVAPVVTDVVTPVVGALEPVIVPVVDVTIPVVDVVAPVVRPSVGSVVKTPAVGTPAVSVDATVAVSATPSGDVLDASADVGIVAPTFADTQSVAIRAALEGRGTAAPIGAATVTITGDDAPATVTANPVAPTEHGFPTPTVTGSPANAAGASGAGFGSDQGTTPATPSLFLAAVISSLPADDAVPTSLSSDPGSSPD
jgi:hypothetical protein